jgi:16S rRNA pseudouridine516 synthase
MRRLDQLLANLGYCSRREARDFLRTHEVHGGDGARLTQPALKVDPASVRIDGEPLDHPDGLLLLLHKPIGLVCSHDRSEGPSVYDLLPPRWQQRNPGITSVGRLDKDTSGLLLLTDQTALVHRLTSPRHHVEKRYHATVDHDLPPALGEVFAAGTLRLDGEESPCLPARYEALGPREAFLTLTEGRYHQVRRMFAAAAGATVLTLHRDRFGPLELGDLPSGQWRILALDTFSATSSPS